MKKAEVTSNDWKLFKSNASLKNAIKTEFTQVTNPKTKNNIPIMINGPVELLVSLFVVMFLVII